MSTCDRLEPGTIEQYFYGELPPHEAVRVEDHLRACAACREHIADLHAVADALAHESVVDAPAAGEWTGFMQRLEAQTSRASGTTWQRAVRRGASVAAVLTVIVIGGALGLRDARMASHGGSRQTVASVHAVQSADTTPRAALQTATAEHLERSKVVVLDLAMRDPNEKPVDWQDERRLARSLLSDTRLYRLTAEEQGRTDIARVMRDLETVLLEASMSDGHDPKALSRVQRLISKRDLLMKMQVVSTSGT